jgi:hypothetical protein
MQRYQLPLKLLKLQLPYRTHYCYYLTLQRLVLVMAINHYSNQLRVRTIPTTMMTIGKDQTMSFVLALALLVFFLAAFAALAACRASYV